MVYFLLFLYFLYFVWDNFYDIMILINEKVLLIKAIYYKHNCSYNSFMSLFKNSISSFIDYVISVIYTIDSLSNICITLLMVYDIIYLLDLLSFLLLFFL